MEDEVLWKTHKSNIILSDSTKAYMPYTDTLAGRSAPIFLEGVQLVIATIFKPKDIINQEVKE